MKKENKEPVEILAEKMAELINKGQILALKEERFRNSLGTRLKTPPKSSKK